MLNKQLSASSNIQNSVIGSGKNFLITINKASQEINNNLTGGDAYLIAAVTTTGLQRGILHVYNKFAIAIPNPTIIVEDYTNTQSCHCIVKDIYTYCDSACIAINSTQDILEKIGRKSAVDLPQTSKLIGGSGEIKKFIIYFILPNITYYEKLVFTIKDEKVFNSYVLGKIENGREEIFDKSENYSKIKWQQEFSQPVFRAKSTFN